jgi:serine phosphatase RsbU (regulator of sigma subunit)
MVELPARVADQLHAYGDRAVAYLQIDADLTLIGAGGRLEHFGLTALRLGEPALEQVVFLEGLLPLIETSDFVPSVEVASGRATDLHFNLDGDKVWVLLLDVTADRETARRVQQKAYEMTLLQEKEARLNRQLEAANVALLATQRELEASRDQARRDLARKQTELAEARTLQLSLVPPSYKGSVGRFAVTVDVMLEPAKEVGGDLVDHFCIGRDLLVVLLGDVSDKGAGAALIMARTHALFRGLLWRPDAEQLFRAPHEAMRLVNETLAAGTSSRMFVTLLIAVFDGVTQQLTYARAGRVSPFLRRAGGAVERLGALGGVPLGLIVGGVCRSTSVTMSPGDELLIVTDGVTDAMDPCQRLFGEERVEELLRHRTTPATALLDELLAAVRVFEAGGPQSDDIAAALLNVRTGQRRGPDAGERHAEPVSDRTAGAHHACCWARMRGRRRWRSPPPGISCNAYTVSDDKPNGATRRSVHAIIHAISARSLRNVRR